MRQGGGLLGLFGLVALGVIIADVELHPAGTQAGLNGLNGILKTSLSGMLGGGKIAG